MCLRTYVLQWSWPDNEVILDIVRQRLGVATVLIGDQCVLGGDSRA